MAKKHSPRFLALVNNARTRVNEIDVAELQRRLDAGGVKILIDVREESEYAAGHVEGAQHLGKGVIERDIEKEIPDTDAELLLYCGGGYRSVLAAENMQRMGYSNVHSVKGGFTALREAGFPITESDSTQK